jgi:capsid portal protein
MSDETASMIVDMMEPTGAAVDMGETGNVTTKALVLNGPQGADIAPRMRIEAPDEDGQRFTRAGAIAPPYDPAFVALRVAESTALGPAIRTLQNNVHSHGHRYEPVFNLDADDAKREVKRAIALERLRKHSGGWRQALRSGKTALDFAPTDQDVEFRMARVRAQMDLELMALDSLFSVATPGSTFTEVRRRMGADRDSAGYGFFIMQRDGSGDLALFDHVPFTQMYLRPIICTARGAPWYVRTKVPVRSTKITIDHVSIPRVYRSMVQIGMRRDVFYKQYGCPLVVSADDGRAMRSTSGLRQNEHEAIEAYHFSNYSPLTVYGTPPWEAASPVVSGVRDAQVVNGVHFRNNGIPRMVILISGGSLKPGADEKLKSIIEGHAKGIEKYGSILILEAESQRVGMGMQRTVIELKPLKEAIPDDALFQKYEANGRDTILSQYGLPRFVIGLLEDVNKSTATEGLAFVEKQVYQPMRSIFDAHMDNILMNEGICWWRFVSNSPVARDPKTIAEITAIMANANALTPNDMRPILAEIYNRPFTTFDNELADLPIELSKLCFGGAGLAGGAVINSAPLGSDVTRKSAPPEITPQDLASFLVRAENAMRDRAVKSMEADIATANGRVLAIAVPTSTIADLVEPAINGSGA